MNKSSSSNRVTVIDYYYQVAVESYASRLQYLAEYELGDDGTFEIALSILLAIAVPKADEGRDMLYLLVCNADAAKTFLDLPAASNDTSVPSYCAMPNRTLDYYCQSVPLDDESPDDYVYQSLKVVSGSMAELSPPPYSLFSRENADGDSKASKSSSSNVVFFLDSCETLGGQNGILRSCLSRPPRSRSNGRGSQDDTSCFYCPPNYPTSYTREISADAEREGCKTSPPLPPTIRGTVSMNLCTAQGNCLGKATRSRSTFFGLTALAWAVTSFAWIVHIRSAARDAVVELQTKMKLVPVTQTLHSIAYFADLSSAHKLVGTARSLVHSIAILAQLVAFAVFAEVVVVIAKGWKITRPALLPREIQWIRFVTLSWAASFAVLKHAGDKQLAVVIVWGLSWACVVFMIWYNSAYNLNMLKYQLAMVRQLDLDPQLTPVHTKFMLFRRFRALLAAYIFLSCFLGVVGLVKDATHQSSEWTSLLGDEGLTFFLFVSLGYTFRCRRFGRLLRVPNTTVPQPDGGTNQSVDQNSVHPASILPEPTSLESAEASKRKRTIFVLNPDHAPSLATTIEPSEHVVWPNPLPKSTVTPENTT
ncbi:hypothetical protein PInf_017998 [Phytophthora infestans]|nr:hypothetical protein PInf_017998 [Phytophthora infestans]